MSFLVTLLLWILTGFTVVRVLIAVDYDGFKTECTNDLSQAVFYILVWPMLLLFFVVDTNIVIRAFRKVMGLKK